METITTSIVIQRPVAEVFAFVADARNNPLWQTRAGLRQTRQEPDGPVGIGTRITETWHFMGRDTESQSEVTEFELDRMYTRSTIGGGGPIKRGTYTFEAVAEGTRWVSETQVQAGGLFAIAEPLLAGVMRKGFDTTMAAAKALLERRVAENAR
jgi:uncharacterized protein YndB with AHSA1/START domain